MALIYQMPLSLIFHDLDATKTTDIYSDLTLGKGYNMRGESLGDVHQVHPNIPTCNTLSDSSLSHSIMPWIFIKSFIGFLSIGFPQ